MTNDAVVNLIDRPLYRNVVVGTGNCPKSNVWTKLPNVMKRKISSIIVPAERRSIDYAKVLALAESIRIVGLLNPVTIAKDGTLIAGAHRLAAHKLLGFDEIECIVLDCDELRKKLIEIDENLIRNDLDAIGIGEHALRRDEILDAMGVRAKSGDNRFSDRGAESAPLQTTADIAKEIGISKRVLQENKQLARNLVPKAKGAVRKANATKQEALKLARKSYEEQNAIAQTILDSKAATVSDAIRAVEQDAMRVRLESIATQSATKNTKNVIICGDAIEVMRQIPDESVDLIITSPPYNLFDSREGSRWGGDAYARRKMKYGYAGGYTDNMPRTQYIEWQRQCLTEMMRLIPDTGAIFYNHKWRVQNGLIQDQSPIVEGFPVRQIIIWHRTGGMNFNDNYFLPSYEVIYAICKRKFKLLPNANHIGDVWRIHQETDNEHPCPFPIELPHQIIRSTAAKTVLDPFVGSGTTCVAAKQLGRNYIGIDLSQQYVAMAEERLNGCRAEMPLF